ncbi:Nucleolar complex 3-like protein [Rhynchospora pubera]|uniref:Nucleolar complex 3-like protein n=1 Tax=Rhynchospora pubera TaxID=906938 RepID=A0AAV8H8U4_9POAL|nr:Nucleolar complex 3-like protein [Rhynchospora pubera]
MAAQNIVTEYPTPTKPKHQPPCLLQTPKDKCRSPQITYFLPPNTPFSPKELKKMGKRRKVILPPALPPETPDEEFEISDEDVEFFSENRSFTHFLAHFDRKKIDKHVTRVADKSEDEIERLYERRTRNNAPLDSRENDLQVDPVDALPIKTLDGKLQYRTTKKVRSEEGHASTDLTGEEDAEKQGTNLIRLTKAERNKKLKKEKKEAKKLKEDEDIAPNSPKEKIHSEVLKEVEEEISAEESFGVKKIKLAEIGMALLEDPEANIRSLKELLDFCKDKDPQVVKLGLMSMLAVFKDIIPSYRIRELTDKELAMPVSEAVRKTRYFEYTLLRSYKSYLQKLIELQKEAIFKLVVVRCMCTLLEAAPHFNLSEKLLAGTVRNISSSDDVIRKLCCEAIKSLFKNEGKHGGEGTVRAVCLIAQLVKKHHCQLHPDCLEVFLSLRFDEDLGKHENKAEEKNKFTKNKKGKQEPMKHLPPSEKKKSKQELIAKTRGEVYADYKAVSFAPDSEKRQRMQSDTLSAVFETYFRILKHAVDASDPRFMSETSGSHAQPLLAPCLEGLGKFSHLIDLDFMADLMSCLKQLSGFSSGTHLQSKTFNIMKSNLDALNIDLQDFFVQLYNLLLEYRPYRDRGEVLAEALKTMLWDGRQHDMQRAAAFIKRLATFSLSFGSSEAMAALATLKQLLQKNTKCRSLLENDAGGGSISGLVVKYQPEATDPYLSGALASVLWELSLLSKHYNPSVSQMASNILSMTNLKPTQNIVNPSLIALNPIQAFWESTVQKELLKSMNAKVPPSLKRKRKREQDMEYYVLDPQKLRNIDSEVIGEEEARLRFEEHFKVLRDISENERLKGELNRTLASISLYDEFKREKREKERSVVLKSGKKKAKILVKRSSS